ncbi:hypothetical protein D3C87_1800020 [compost metagenome]
MNVMAVYKNRPLGRIVQADQQMHQGAFAAAHPAHNSQAGPLGDGQAYIPQSRLRRFGIVEG